MESCVKTVVLGNEKITFGIEVTDEKTITMWPCYTLWLQAVGDT